MVHLSPFYFLACMCMVQGIPYSHSNCPCYTCFYPNNRCHKICDPGKIDCANGLDSYMPCSIAEFVPCPVFECTRSRQRIVQQPADLTTLASYLLNKAVSFIQRNAGTVMDYTMMCPYKGHDLVMLALSPKNIFSTSPWKRGTIQSIIFLQPKAGRSFCSTPSTTHTGPSLVDRNFTTPHDEALSVTLW